MPQRINLTEEAIQLLEAFTPLGATVEKFKVGRLWEVPVDDRTYNMLLQARRVDENWSDVILRLVREAQKVQGFRKNERSS